MRTKRKNCSTVLLLLKFILSWKNSFNRQRVDRYHHDYFIIQLRSTVCCRFAMAWALHVIQMESTKQSHFNVFFFVCVCAYFSSTNEHKKLPYQMHMVVNHIFCRNLEFQHLRACIWWISMFYVLHLKTRIKWNQKKNYHQIEWNRPLYIE